MYVVNLALLLVRAVHITIVLTMSVSGEAWPLTKVRYDIVQRLLVHT